MRKDKGGGGWGRDGNHRRGKKIRRGTKGKHLHSEHSILREGTKKKLRALSGGGALEASGQEGLKRNQSIRKD